MNEEKNHQKQNKWYHEDNTEPSSLLLLFLHIKSWNDKEERRWEKLHHLQWCSLLCSPIYLFIDPLMSWSSKGPRKLYRILTISSVKWKHRTRPVITFYCPGCLKRCIFPFFVELSGKWISLRIELQKSFKIEV